MVLKLTSGDPAEAIINDPEVPPPEVPPSEVPPPEVPPPESQLLNCLI